MPSSTWQQFPRPGHRAGWAASLEALRSRCASPAPAPCRWLSTPLTPQHLFLPLQTPPNWVAIGLRISRFYTSYLSATVPPMVWRGRGHQGTPAALSSRCPAANPNIVLLLVKGFSKSLSSIRFHRADAAGAEAGISFFSRGAPLCSPGSPRRCMSWQPCWGQRRGEEA